MLKVLAKVKRSLETRSVRALRGITKAFKNILIHNGVRKLDKQEFFFGIRDYGVQISKREAEIILDYLDTEEDGFVNLDAFLQAIRGKPNATRQAWIDKAWNKIDKEGNGYVTAYDIRQIFDCSQHPEVISGEMCFDEVFTQFLQSFGDKNQDGTITYAEWNDYYAAVSSSISKCEIFADLIKTCWKLQ
jgi:Ca2+-binding EF-hand superfamily protein